MIVSSPSSQQRLVILLHGMGGSGASMMPVVGPWRRELPNTRFAAPDAPFPSGQGGHQWFRVDGQELRPDHVAFVRDEFDHLIQDIVEREGFKNALDHVAFVSVSQGSIMALDAVASGRWKVGALVSFAGLLPLLPTTASDHMPVLLVHGQDDTRIPVQASKVAAGQLRAAGFDVELDVIPGVGHTISVEGAEKALAFLKKRFA
jgi:phospholipase/carboxylesterase